MLTMINARLLLDVIRPEFEPLFFASAVEEASESNREHIWNSMQAFFTHSCIKAFMTVNGNGTELSDSDSENKMDIDFRPNDLRDIVSFLWQVTINCLKKGSAHIPLAGKAFDTSAQMLR